MKRRPPKNIRQNRRPGPGVGQLIDVTLGDPAHGGACVAREESGRVVFVRHGLPGEQVRARVTSARQSLAWADVVDVIEPSPDRVTSVWPDAGSGGVGGGELAHVKPEAQRRWKAEVIRTQLRRVGGEGVALAVEDLGGVHVNPAPGDEDPDDALLGRRTRIEMVITEGGVAGMHRYRGRDVLPLHSMPLAVPAIGELGLFGPDSPWREIWKPGERVRVVAPNGEHPVVVTPQGTFDADRQQISPAPLTWQVQAGGRSWMYRVRPTGFWQTHLRGADVLAQAVLDGVGGASLEGASLAELYSGAGLFTQILSAAVGPAGHVVSLEGEQESVADAHNNLAGLGQAETFVGDVDANGVSQLVGHLGRCHGLVLDPPRSGAGRDVCRAITDSPAERVVLVSCDPAAGARDLKYLTEGGLNLESFQAWDLFPHTHHVEFIGVLTR